MLYRYFLIILACAAIMTGVQVPNFVTQYEQRLDAQWTEAKVYYDQYQAIADQYFEGDMNALLQHHEQSDDEVFRAESVPLGTLLERVRTFEYQLRELNTTIWGKLWFLAHSADEELLDGTWRNYSFTVPLTQDALILGIIFMFAIVVLVDGCCSGCRYWWRRRRASRPSPGIRRQ
ncbi:hypothetical protein C9940_05070 [Pseudidiomarina aestuarii]|uniref:DUF2937 domain-containing protein n=1 Tax=Pseudidiomarina aestuarii TaxID=624146 RepID=A0A2T4CW08_9GAMM|nr:hypothetical protein C9988_02765 [Pseudidiomarina aestuarii]PTB85731.1 hypothetical protein C9940_05070 [Pseudidiomarina aestuarii]PTB89876.1 hypothetical protein C9928_02010 [Pseudidiomarina aestuarii]